MALSAGTRLGSYEIVDAIGAGGMGEVYRARDTRLGRDVAIKILPDLFSGDADRLARFEREAQLLASLNHPNIAAIYGLEESGPLTALILELVEGETLADRLTPPQGHALQLEDTLAIAKQIAEALETAHEQGIVHRDLKPANVKIRPDGTVKVLDFGLAKMLDAGGAGGAGRSDRAGGQQLTNSPTLLGMGATHAGMIVGTVAYMAPEQAKGKSVDRRADIWAFGVVLFEMFTGQPLFAGETAPEILARVIEREPDLNALPESTPPPIRALIARCLTKDPRNRLQAIGEARIVIERAIAHPGADAPAAPVEALKSRSFALLPWMTTGVAIVACSIVLAMWAPWRAEPPRPQVRVSVEIGADASLDTAGASAALLSRDGTMLAFVAQPTSGTRTPQIYVRRLDQLRATPLAGTEGARDAFFSPDGQWIAFFADTKLKKISVTGGAAVVLCDAINDRGGWWAEDGAIVFSPTATSGLFRVSSAGGKPDPLTKPGDGEVTHRFPQVLPGGKAVLFTAHSATGGFDDANLVIQTLSNGDRRIVKRGAYFGRYVPSGLGAPKRADREGGHLVYINGGTLFAAPFDLEQLKETGPPTPVIERVSAGPSTGIGGRAQVTVSETGTLVYLPGGGASDAIPIDWMTRDGKATPLRATPADWSSVRFAPDGQRIAIVMAQGGNRDIWIYEWRRDTLTRLTFDPADDIDPAWTPDGRRVLFASNRGGAFHIHWQLSDGTGEVQRLTEGVNSQRMPSLHPDGKVLAFAQTNAQTTTWNLITVSMEGGDIPGRNTGKPTTFLDTPFITRQPMFSPDGRWLAYTSVESGRNEVYVRPFPGPGGKWQISTAGGTMPVWSRTRKELFYATNDQRLMVVPYEVDGDSFRADTPRSWSDARFIVTAGDYEQFDLHPDGERFALARARDTDALARQDQVVFVFNFFDELKRLAPSGRR